MEERAAGARSAKKKPSQSNGNSNSSAYYNNYNRNEKPNQDKRNKISKQSAYSEYQIQPVQGQQRGLTQNFQDYKFADLPKLIRSRSQEQMMALLRRKIAECCIIYSFKTSLSSQSSSSSNSSGKPKDKQLKRQTLLEIVDFLNGIDGMASTVQYNEQISAELFKMIEINIFRTFGGGGSGQNKQTLDPDQEEPNLQEAWPHLQIVYELLLRFIISEDVDIKLAKQFLTNTFILKLLDLFNSQDPRQRDYLKTLVHRIYGRFMPLRSFIRKSIQNIFFKLIFQREQHNGVAELLQILSAVISGFAKPLKEEHKQFLQRALVPLHKTHSLAMYHSQLSACIKQFLEKDQTLVKNVLQGLLKFWPITNASKEVLFLNQIEDIIDSHKITDLQSPLMQKLFKRICNCITSSHFQVAQRSLFLWNNDKLIKIVSQNKQMIFPIGVKSLLKNSKYHWNTTVQGLTYNVLKILMELDQTFFDSTSMQVEINEQNLQKKYEENNEKWKRLQNSILQNNRDEL